MSYPEDPDRTRELPAHLDPRGVTRPSEPFGGAAYDPRLDHPDRRYGPPPPRPRQGPPPPYDPSRDARDPRDPRDRPPGPGGAGRYATPPPRRRRRGWRVLGSLLLVLLLAIAGFAVYLDFSLGREDVLADYEGRPADTPGVTWLLVGSDSREDLTDDQKEELATGDVDGKRTDTIMLLHLPDGAVAPTLVSLPRDTLVDIPGHGQQKLNAAFAFGGGRLLAQTVEQKTGLRIDRYAEIGFGGFAGVVDAIGGVDLCIEEPMNDPKAGLDLQAGCQTLDGAQALGYVRTRASANADLDRIERQRQFLAALLAKASSPGTLLNPLRSVPLALNATRTLIVDDGCHLWHLAAMGMGMGADDLVTTTVPIAGTPTIGDIGSVVQWNEDLAAAFFAALAADEAIPAELVSGG